MAEPQQVWLNGEELVGADDFTTDGNSVILSYDLTEGDWIRARDEARWYGCIIEETHPADTPLEICVDGCVDKTLPRMLGEWMRTCMTRRQAPA